VVRFVEIGVHAALRAAMSGRTRARPWLLVAEAAANALEVLNGGVDGPGQSAAAARNHEEPLVRGSVDLG
jgi:hypothetical protein